jgi:hypothetical protein
MIVSRAALLVAVLAASAVLAVPASSKPRTVIRPGDQVQVHGTRSAWDGRKGTALRRDKRGRWLVRFMVRHRRQDRWLAAARLRIIRLKPAPTPVALPHPAPPAPVVAAGAPVTLPSLAPAPSPTPTPTPTPTPIPVTVVDSVDGLVAATQSAPNDSVIEIKPGSYAAALLNVPRTGWVTIRPQAGGDVTFADLDFGSNAAFMRVEGVHVNARVKLAESDPFDADPPGAHHIAVAGSWVQGFSAGAGTHDLLFDHNDITAPNHGNGVELQSTWPNDDAPPGTVKQPLISNVTIRGNRFHDIATDAMIMGNFQHVVVEDNEITGLLEVGQHTDALQTVTGGSDLTFRGNYVHDNDGEGLFIKDGQVKDVVVDDNLFMRNLREYQISFYNCVPGTTANGIRLVHNTVWDSTTPLGVLGSANRSVLIHQNVVHHMTVEFPDVMQTEIDETANVIRKEPDAGTDGWRAQPGDVVAQPLFGDPNLPADDLLLLPQSPGYGLGAGVTWKPADKHFGP